MTSTIETSRRRRAAAARGTLPAIAALGILLAALASPLASGPARAQATLPDGFRDSLVVGGLDSPIAMAFLPDGRMLVIEQKTTAIKLVRNGTVMAPNPLFTVPGVNTTGDERGLLGIAVDPGWPARPYIYLHMNNVAGTETIRITRYTVAGDLDNTGNGALSIDGNTRRDILTGVPDQFDNHNGGTVRFGPDGMLYASFGEDATRCPAQDQLTLRGVIVRLNVSGVAAGGGPEPSRTSIAAAGNPLINNADDRAKLIWAWGLRNPFRFQIDSANGALFIADVGENTWEEVDRAAAGGLNFGWPRYEALSDMDTGCTPSSSTTAPIHFYNHNTGGVVVISAGVYRAPSGTCNGCFDNAYVGDFFLSDYYGGFMRRLTGSGSSWSLAPQVAGQPSATEWATGMDYVSDYAIGPGGGLWYCKQSDGQIRAILGDGSGAPPPPPPPPAVSFSFARPYPQPAPGSVNLSYTLSAAVRVKLRIYDLRGALVRTLVNGDRAGGARIEVWDGTGDDGDRAPSGLYVARLEANGRAAEHRVMLVR